MKILLTGAAGNLGSACYAELLKGGFDVFATDATRRADLPGRVKVGDLLNREFCYEITEDIDIVVHIANHPNAWRGNAQKVFNENVTMNMNVFQAATDSGCRRLIYASSIQAMSGYRMDHNQPRESHLSYLPIDGESPQRPGNPYALSKCVGEMQLQYFIANQRVDQAVALRFPMLISCEWMEDWRERYGGGGSRGSTGGRRGSGGRGGAMHSPNLDEAFTWLSFEDAARLVHALINKPSSGYRCYLPAHPQPRVEKSPRELIEQHYQSIPRRGEIDAPLCDIRTITADTGWEPVDNLWT